MALTNQIKHGCIVENPNEGDSMSAKKFDSEEIRKLYESGLGCNAIAKMLGAGKATITERIRKMGISRTRTEANKTRSLYDINQIRDLYLSGKSSTEISDIIGCAPALVSIHVKNMGISRSCKEAQLLRSKQGKSSGPNSPGWRGGRFIAHGYVHLYMPDHHLANPKGYVREHRLVWEQANGKRLTPDMSVHHLNGIKDDNRPENLIALPNTEHSKTHSKVYYKARIRALEERVRQLEEQLSHKGERS